MPEDWGSFLAGLFLGAALTYFGLLLLGMSTDPDEW